MGNAPRDEDGYLRAVAETLSEWNSPEDEAAWRDIEPDGQRSASEQERTLRGQGSHRHGISGGAGRVGPQSANPKEHPEQHHD